MVGSSKTFICAIGQFYSIWNATPKNNALLLLLFITMGKVLMKNFLNLSSIRRIIKKIKEATSILGYPSSMRARKSSLKHSLSERKCQETTGTSICYQLTRISHLKKLLQSIIANDPDLHVYKIQMTQELKPVDHLKQRFPTWEARLPG